MSTPTAITSRDNPLLVKLRKLAQDPAAYRKLGAVWLEGDHLCSALQLRGKAASRAVITESAWAEDARLRQLAAWAAQVHVVPDALFKAISGLESPARLGFVLEAEALAALGGGVQVPLWPDVATVVLDRLQDAGNVGSILRTAAAFGVHQVLALQGTAALWSPKVLRAGMGAHFALHLVEGLQPQDLAALTVPLVGTSLATDQLLHTAALPHPCAWVLGHEGQGVAPEVLARCALTLRIPQPGGEESLNVGAAAAVCLYESARRLSLP
jgi:TrmH family RNA methyltransferase